MLSGLGDPPPLRERRVRHRHASPVIPATHHRSLLAEGACTPCSGPPGPHLGAHINAADSRTTPEYDKCEPRKVVSAFPSRRQIADYERLRPVRPRGTAERRLSITAYGQSAGHQSE